MESQCPWQSQEQLLNATVPQENDARIHTTSQNGIRYTTGPGEDL